jgi:GTPase Era involved in 16S rRNA processing
LGAWHWLEKSCAVGIKLTGVRGWRQVPYSSYVETTAYKQQPDGSVRIEQTIFVETEGQKKILVGMIKDLGTKARSEMIKFLGCNVHLFLQVSPAPAPVAWPASCHISSRLRFS